MRIPDLSTPLPLLARGEPGCDDIDSLTQSAREAILAASLGSLRRCGRGWFGRDKRRPFHRRTIAALIERGLLFPDLRIAPNAARITKRGKWLARTICSEIAGAPFATAHWEENEHVTPQVD